ncbi:MAG: hypothetical protein EOM83_02265 [Clostridia bacterium]|nr:hypothetical protein [Clostridia bacterium]
MSHYLSDIASRSIGNEPHFLRPSTPLFTPSDPEISPDVADENNLHENAGHNQFVPQNIIPVQPIRLPDLQQPDITSRAESPALDENNGSFYFSKHIERVEPDQEKKPVVHQFHESGSFKTEETSQRFSVKSISEKNKVIETTFEDKTVLKIIPEEKGSENRKNETTFEDKTVSKITPEQNGSKNPKSEILDNKTNEAADREDEIIINKKLIINPAAKDEAPKKSELRPNSSPIELLKPNRLNQDKPIQVINKTKQPAPKLVVGKIIVEILPPIVPIPKKTLTRFVQPSSANSHSKSNKLSFGLGQL